MAPNGNFDSWVPGYTNYNDAGSGSSTDPFQIYTSAQMQSLAAHSEAWGASYDYQLMNDIDMSEVQLSQPIGTASNSFLGTFDGQGFTLKNLSIMSSMDQSVGVFGSVGGRVENLNFDHVSLNASTATELGLIGYNAGTIQNVHVTNSIINGSNNVGGLVGYNAGSVLGCSVETTQVTALTNFGGLIGAMDGGSVQGSFSAAVLSPSTEANSTYIGGLIGSVSCAGCSIQNDYSAATISFVGPATSVGGLVGGMTGSSSVTVKTCYSAGHISAPSAPVNSVGGLVGALNSSDQIPNSFSATSINVGSGSSGVDYLVGSGGNGSSAVGSSYVSTVICIIAGSSCSAGSNNTTNSVSYPLSSYEGPWIGNSAVSVPAGATLPGFDAGPWVFPDGGGTLPQLQFGSAFLSGASS